MFVIAEECEFVKGSECGPSEYELAKASFLHIATMAKLPKNFIDFLKMSIEEHSTYADPITIKYAKVDCFGEKHGKNVDMETINETSIANVAYMALHSDY